MEYANPAYPVHVPPSMQGRPKPTRRRRSKPPASVSKLERPLTRFYCNDCKKKFRSRILANRNNNAVQHYCSLYAKIITRKVDSHSNKCKGDHGMGPCVVKRTDIDPDSDGEDETKAAYYADKGKRPRSTTSKRTASKRKLKDRDISAVTDAKRQRIDPNIDGPVVAIPPTNIPHGSSASINYPPPAPEYHGYYASNGYMRPHEYGQHGGYNHGPPPVYKEYISDQNAMSMPFTMPPPPPPADDFNDAPPMEDLNDSSMPPPPPITESRSTENGENGGSMTPTAIPMPLSTDDVVMTAQSGCIPPRIEDGLRPNQDEIDHVPPPPPPLEEFEPIPDPLPIDDETNNTVPTVEEKEIETVNVNVNENEKENDKEMVNGLSLVEVRDNNAGHMITLDGNNKVHGVNGNVNGNANGQKSGDAEDVTKGNLSLNNGHVQSAQSDEDCINVTDDDDDIPELKPPCGTPSPSGKRNKGGQDENEEDEDDDLLLNLPE